MDPQIRARRERLARGMAHEELPGLLEFTGRPELGAVEVEDAVCARLGDLMHRYDAEGGGDPAGSDYLEPDRVLGALTTAVVEVLGAPGGVPRSADFAPDGSLFAAWRLWEVLREIAPAAEAGALYGFEDVLRSRLGAPLPTSTVRTLVADSLCWASDAYGSRFLVTAEFERAGRVRWYAWDIDACGYEAVTVDAGFHESSASALERWRAAAGETSTGSAALEPVDDAARWGRVASLLPEIETYGRIGGESAAQLGEYHRSRRLARAVREATRFPDTVPGTESGSVELVRKWADQFATWLSAREPGRAYAFDIHELAPALAETWAGQVPQELFLTCSPHRVAAKVRACHGFYRADFATALQELLPHWVRWIGEQTGLAQHLLERSLDYCDGRSHPAQSRDGRELEWYAVCTE